jgi:hypothetical protein
LTGHLYDSVKVYVQCNEIEALPKRQGTEIRSKDAMAPVWVKSVATPDAAASPNKGGFSKTRCLSTSRPAGKTGALEGAAGASFFELRLMGLNP